jgi:hypothetical protein
MVSSRNGTSLPSNMPQLELGSFVVPTMPSRLQTPIRINRTPCIIGLENEADIIPIPSSRPKNCAHPAAENRTM